MVWQLVVFVVFGTVIGALGRLLVAGERASAVAPWIAHGVLGAVVGGALGHLAEARAPDPTTGALLASYVGAIAAVTLHRARVVWSDESPLISRRFVSR